MAKICYKCGKKKGLFEKYHKLEWTHALIGQTNTLFVCEECFTTRITEIIKDFNMIKRSYRSFAPYGYFIDGKMVSVQVDPSDIVYSRKIR
jgi:hypothetical protein